MSAWSGAAVERSEPPGAGARRSPPVEPQDVQGDRSQDAMDLAGASALARTLHDTVGKVVLGAPGAVTVAVCAAISGGHLLVEDVPGTGKTVLARTLATALGAELSRIQGHTDLLPSDITGVSVYSPERGDWRFHQGPVFAHVVLLDELNRTPPRTQSALLEAMAEEQVTVDGARWPLPHPHLVIATQNPGQLGTFPLVESQLDRFALSTQLGYPELGTEIDLVMGEGGQDALAKLRPVCSTAAWGRLVDACMAVHVAPEVAGYAVRLARATREAQAVRLGASPRASITLVRSAQAHALLEGRSYAIPDDVQALAVAGLAHRLVTDAAVDHRVDVVREALASVPVPRP
ncbi:MAG: MoxR family ATPase [Actinomycetota bacterium]|nr:MoxR family ATPase [Actinomycetota bacterium]